MASIVSHRRFFSYVSPSGKGTHLHLASPFEGNAIRLSVCVIACPDGSRTRNDIWIASLARVFGLNLMTLPFEGEGFERTRLLRNAAL